MPHYLCRPGTGFHYAFSNRHFLCVFTPLLTLPTFLGALLFATLLLPAFALSDYESGRKAANRGNFVKAYSIWLPLAQSGSAQASYSLGRMYARGDGVSKSYQKAYKWFLRAAKSNHPAAMRSLGQMYNFGDGVRYDMAKAFAWYQEAAKAGDSEAKRKVREITARLAGGKPLRSFGIVNLNTIWPILS